ncbi:carbohydrate esterase family 2 protein [Piromyces sp. E2]|nr:carbohydrate esterase family 2 protein [Piromyces sp. E2]|eukprot:OUM60909.1 carbohydrate esterase family 2 protein [Piromyces sp. E2]
MIKLGLLLITALNAVSALPVTETSTNNPYLICDVNDYDCKREQSSLCYGQVYECWSSGYTNSMKCIEMSQLCNEIWYHSSLPQNEAISQETVTSSEGLTEETTMMSLPTVVPSDIINEEKIESESIIMPTKSIPVTIPTETQIESPTMDIPINNNDNEYLNSFEATEDNVKIMGRTIFDEILGSLWLGHSASGIEYKFIGKYSKIIITGDSSYSSYSIDRPARLVVYGDDKLYIDMTLSEKVTELVVEFNEIAEHTIRFMKVSECMMGSIFIDEIRTDAEKIEPTAYNNKKIEFIGDSITCGYGVDGTGDGFSTKTENGSRTFAYLASKKLNADYSMVAFSGCGVLSGYSNNGVRNTDLIMSKHYHEFGYVADQEPSVSNMSEIEWDSKRFVPDLVVINLGTNDVSYLNSITDEEKKESEKAAFIAEYENLITDVRATNPNAEILCALGIMGADVYPQIEEAVHNYVSETGDTKVNLYKFNSQNIEKNGKGVDWHPAPQSHVDAAYELIDQIETLYGWTADPTVNIDL